MFIYKGKINKKTCKKLINIFEKNNKKEFVKTNHPTMTQIVLHKDERCLFSFKKELIKIKNTYIKKYKYIDKKQEPWDIFPYIKIQKYKPGESYFGWHAEVNGEWNHEYNSKDRILVFSTFLNTIKKGGETEFFYQKEKIKPVEGKTILFPAFWTHTHKGNLTKEIKYIITGWYTYVH